MSMMNLSSQSTNNSDVFKSLIQPFHKVADYVDYKFKELSQEDIEKIYKINNTFLVHRERLLSALFPDAIKLNEFTFGNDIFRLCIKRFGSYEVGYWECYVKVLSRILNPFVINFYEIDYQVSSDLISLVAVRYNFSFKKALELLYGHITTNTTLYPQVIIGKGGYREELFPISKKLNIRTKNNFTQQLIKNGAVLSEYSLNDSITFLHKYSYKNNDGRYLEIFFGYFHRYNSAQNTFIAMNISQFNSLNYQYPNTFCKENSNLKKMIETFNNNYKKKIKFLLSDFPNDFKLISKIPYPSNLPYGLMVKNINYLYQFDFSALENHVIFIEMSTDYYAVEKVLLSSLEKLKEIEKEYYIDFYIYYACNRKTLDKNNITIKNDKIKNELKNLFEYIYCEGQLITCLTLQEFLSSELFNKFVVNDKENTKPKEIQQKSFSSGFSLAKDGFANQNRKIEPILSPIINSGQVIWLYAPEKIGKTFLAISIATAVSTKENCTVCGWQSNSPKKVLYIDGEMAGVGLRKIHSLIVQGFKCENKDLSFDNFLFIESDEEYNTILDPLWLEKYQSRLYSYDLIILDSYYSLNNNSRSLKAFFAFLKDLKKHDVAVLVIDHTNRDGDLQGSIDKRRIADLGIQLQKGKNENEICITYEFDRNGISSSLTSKRFYKDFSNSAFKFVEVKEKEIEHKLCQGEHTALLEYILHSFFKMKQKEIAASHNNKNYNKRVSEHCKIMKRIVEKEEVLDKYDCDLLRSKYKEFTMLDKDGCFKMYQEVVTNN